MVFQVFNACIQMKLFSSRSRIYAQSFSKENEEYCCAYTQLDVTVMEGPDHEYNAFQFSFRCYSRWRLELTGELKDRWIDRIMDGQNYCGICRFHFFFVQHG